MIDNIDRNTIANIMFISIHLDAVTTLDNVVDGIASTPVLPGIQEELLLGGQTLILATHQSYIRSDVEVQIISQTSNEVQIIVPYDANTLTITTKDAEGEFVVTTYEVA